MGILIQNQGLFMPLIWAAVSLLVALILYWTSKAFISGDQLFGLPVKQVRIGGSVVIFALVFMLLRQATTAGTVYVPASSLIALGRAAEQVDAARADVETCLATEMLDTPGCRQHVERMANRWREMKIQADALIALGDPAETEGGQ